MQRIFISDERFGQPSLTLTREESRQLRTVLRAEVGMPVEVFDGRGKTVVMRVEAVGKNSLTLQGGQVEIHPPPTCELILVQCLAKGKRMDWIVEKAIELGVSRLQPVISDRTIVRLTEQEARSRLERWERIGIEAARQCQTAWLPVISPIERLTAVLEKVRFDWQAVATLEPVRRKKLQEMLTGNPQQAAMLIGPEGDLTPEEVQLAVSKDWQPVTFGTRVLRTETAAVYALSAMHCAWS